MPSAYHQVNLPKKYQDRICFTSPFGTYKFKRMPQGLKTSAGHFQAMADSIVEEINLPGVEAYIDDFIICSNSFQETIQKLEKLLAVFKKNNLTLNLNKCQFHTSSVEYLGFKISNHKIFPITSNIKKINSFPMPKTKRQVKKFLGLCGFYRALIPAFAEVSEPLVQLTSPKIKFKWEEEQIKSFNKLQEIFFKYPFLQQPDYSKLFYVNTDASAYAISAVLMQKHGNNLLPVSYFSKPLRKAETRYPAIQQELMAIVKGIAAFRYTLYGRGFVVLSDSEPLQHYRKITSPASIITRWLLELDEYNFTIEHIPGKLNILADFLSRTPLEKNCSDLNSDPNLINSKEILPIVEEHKNQDKIQEVINSIISENLDITIEDLLEEQNKDKNLKKIVEDLKNKPNNNRWKNYLVCPKTNLLLFVNKPPNQVSENNFKIVVPEKLKPKCLKIHHLTHYGIDKTYQSICRKFFWKHMYTDVVNFVKSCTTCIISKPQRVPIAPLQNTFIPTRPGEFLSLDFVGPFRNNVHILTVIDHFSKHLKLFPIKHITAMNAVHAIFDYITTFGRPELILSDNGCQFKAEIFEEFNRMLGIKLKHTTVSHPEANSVSERINFSIKATIKALMADGYDFYYAVKIHETMYNSSFHNTIRTSPNKVHFGRNLSTFIDAFQPHDYHNRLDVHQDYYKLMENLNKLYEQVHSNLKNYQSLQNSRQHQTAKLRKFKLGDTVFLDNSNKFKRAVGNKPFKVIEKCSDVIVKIKLIDEPHSRIQTVHINRLVLAPDRSKNLIINSNPNQEDDPINNTTDNLTPVHPTPTVASPNIATPDVGIAQNSDITPVQNLTSTIPLGTHGYNLRATAKGRCKP